MLPEVTVVGRVLYTTAIMQLLLFNCQGCATVESTRDYINNIVTSEQIEPATNPTSNEKRPKPQDR